VINVQHGAKVETANHAMVTMSLKTDNVLLIPNHLLDKLILAVVCGKERYAKNVPKDFSLMKMDYVLPFQIFAKLLIQ